MSIRGFRLRADADVMKTASVCVFFVERNGLLARSATGFVKSSIGVDYANWTRYLHQLWKWMKVLKDELKAHLSDILGGMSGRMIQNNFTEYS